MNEWMKNDCNWQRYVSCFFREYHLKYEELVIPGRNVSDILEIVFKNYDKRIRPFYGGKSITKKGTATIYLWKQKNYCLEGLRLLVIVKWKWNDIQFQELQA